MSSSAKICIYMSYWHRFDVRCDKCCFCKNHTIMTWFSSTERWRIYFQETTTPYLTAETISSSTLKIQLPINSYDESVLISLPTPKRNSPKSLPSRIQNFPVNHPSTSHNRLSIAWLYCINLNINFLVQPLK